MPCTCTISRVHKGSTPPAPTTTTAADEGTQSVDPSSDERPFPPLSTPPPPPPSLPSQCFYCLCTVCGEDRPDIPTVTCDRCKSKTHLTCARDAYSHEWLFVDPATHPTGTPPSVHASARGGGPAGVVASPPSSSPRPPRSPSGTQVLSPATLRETATSSALSSTSPPLSRDGSLRTLTSSSQALLRTAAARIGKDYSYYCHPDCAMGMQVMSNPQFNPALSAHVEAAFARDWQQVLEALSVRFGDALLTCAAEPLSGVEKTVKPASLVSLPGVKEEEEEEKSLDEYPNTLAEPPMSVFDQLHRATGGDAVLANELQRLYSQLRAEAWADYFEQERHSSGHPLFYPPPFVEVLRDAALSHVLEAASPHGQAARLYLLNRATHPAGSAVAIPAGVLARWQHSATAPLVKANDTNNFVAEALNVVVGGAVTAETVMTYSNCGKAGRPVGS